MNAFLIWDADESARLRKLAEIETGKFIKKKKSLRGARDPNTPPGPRAGSCFLTHREAPMDAQPFRVWCLKGLRSPLFLGNFTRPFSTRRVTLDSPLRVTNLAALDESVTMRR